jgi:ABC-type Fe3+ transport system substrate-binding protein
MIHAYTLTFILVSMLNGRQVQVPQTWEDLASPEHCMRVVREVQRSLARARSDAAGCDLLTRRPLEGLTWPRLSRYTWEASGG